MVTPVLSRVPPPPRLAVNDPEFNKWLIDLTNFINSGGGGIDPSLIPGYDALVSTVNLHSIEIASNTVNIAANTSAIAIANANIVSLQSLTSILNARPQVRNGTGVPGAGLGSNGDWYAKTSAATHIYVKIAGAWVVIV
jgi:hypothetical protein